MLFFGCRSERADFFFSNEWLPLVTSGQLQLFTAFSRDQDMKDYVQHRIKERGGVVWEWLHTRGAHVLIAGYVNQWTGCIIAVPRLATWHLCKFSQHL